MSEFNVGEKQNNGRKDHMVLFLRRGVIVHFRVFNETRWNTLENNYYMQFALVRQHFDCRKQILVDNSSVGFDMPKLEDQRGE